MTEHASSYESLSLFLFLFLFLFLCASARVHARVLLVSFKPLFL